MALGLAACSFRPEQPFLERFFEASRLRDRTALQRFSTVTFEPRDQGIVTRFEIVGVTSEERDGRVVNKNVTIVAPVKMSDGRIEIKRLLVTMERRSEEWLITGVVTFPASARN
jgi:hypothetical protein